MKYEKYIRDIVGPDIKCFKSNVYCTGKREKKYRNIKY